ncbi:MAG: hemerythrin family protein [Rhodospirillaceae bacterium]|nr:hemerythrin family protein [Rhodospirillaceae bacterium]
MVELTPSFLMDYESLDKEHQALADIVNLVVEAIDGDDAGKCKTLLPEFVKAAKRHFANEEALLVKIGYPNVKKHQKHHRSLNTKMDHMIEFANMAGENQLARDSLRRELVFFLMDDIITTDMDFKAFIEEKAKTGEA